MPSAWSAVAPAMSWRSASYSRAASRSRSQLASRARFVSAMARGRTGREPGRDACASAASSLRRHDPPHEPEALRVRGRQRIAGQRQLGGPRRADEARQEPRRAAVRHEPDPPERQREARALGGDPEVAGQRERRARARPRRR